MSQKDKRFVVQEHTKGKSVHWDFMLELGDTLQTYRLDKPPDEVRHNPANATKIFDHPLRFLTYQGVVNKGRGTIRIIEAGTYQIVHKEHNQIKLGLNGRVLKGKYLLTSIEAAGWQFATANQSR